MFERWENFYLTAGSAAAGLIGLLFVVATLTAGTDPHRARRSERLFMSPTVFDYAVVFVISAVAMSPGVTGAWMGRIVGATAVIGLGYAVLTAVLIRRLERNEHWTDFWYYGIAPIVCYLALGAIALAFLRREPDAPHWLAAGVVALLLLGVRNAWDLVTWMAPRVEEMKKEE